MRGEEGEAIVLIPLVIRPVIVGIEVIVVAVRAEQFRIAIGNVQNTIRGTAH